MRRTPTKRRSTDQTFVRTSQCITNEKGRTHPLGREAFSHLPNQGNPRFRRGFHPTSNVEPVENLCVSNIAQGPSAWHLPSPSQRSERRRGVPPTHRSTLVALRGASCDPSARASRPPSPLPSCGLQCPPFLSNVHRPLSPFRSMPPFFGSPRERTNRNRSSREPTNCERVLNRYPPNRNRKICLPKRTHVHRKICLSTPRIGSQKSCT